MGYSIYYKASSVLIMLGGDECWMCVRCAASAKMLNAIYSEYKREIRTQHLMLALF